MAVGIENVSRGIGAMKGDVTGESSHCQYKFPLPVEGVPTARRMEIPLLGVCTATMKKLPDVDHPCGVAAGLGKKRDVAILKTKRWNYGACKQLVGEGVILNGDSPPPTRIVDGVAQIVAPTTEEQRLAKKNKLKARGTLLMALPDKHQLKFNIHNDDKSLMEAIEKIFGVCHIRVENSHFDLEKQSDLEEQSLDDLFNNLKIYKAEVKGSSTSSQNIQNIAFVSSNNTNSINESVNDVPSVSATILKAKVSTLPNSFQAEEEPTNYALMDFTSPCSSSSSGSENKVFDCEKFHNQESAYRVTEKQENDRYKTCEGYHAVPPLYTGNFLPSKPDLFFTDDTNASESVANVINVESCKHKTIKDKSKTHRLDAPIIEDWISDSEDETEIESVPKQREPSFVKSTEHVKTSRESIKKIEW
uniref:Uncharacterized protein n=1 Tax=Tanacetum cinerariifolium TaxID=118510 RepID=A0A6L2MVU2_TANCI|nr:hypothetical protein [Tanacetum cinerariifolium]